MIRLLVKEIKDIYIQQNFDMLNKFLGDMALTSAKFQFLELTFTEAQAHLRLPHKRGFVPKDVIQTSLKGTGVVTWHYELFDREFLDISATGPCVVRAFVGSYQEGSTS
jgi:hypothetical protein